MRLLLTGGGTAGHVNPALAIAQTFIEHEDTEVLFVASSEPHDKAQDLVTAAGYPLKTVHICGMHRPRWSPKNVKTLYLMGKSRREAKKIIRDFKPDLIVGTGGYACWPIVSVGADMGIPTAVHESNAKPGKAIMQVRNKVDKILINFAQTAEQLHIEDAQTRVVRVGNPVLAGFAGMTREQARAQLGLKESQIYVLSFGGSLGAEYVSDAVLDMMQALERDYPSLTCLHAAGKRDFARLKDAFEKRNFSERMKLVEYIYDMPIQMLAADVVISRAGAMSISELALTGKAAVIVPSPYVADQHQLHNAQLLSKRGAGICVEESTLSEGGLTEAIRWMLDNPILRREMGRNIREGFAVPDANEKIYTELKKLCVEKGR